MLLTMMILDSPSETVRKSSIKYFMSCFGYCFFFPHSSRKVTKILMELNMCQCVCPLLTGDRGEVDGGIEGRERWKVVGGEEGRKGRGNGG